MNWTLLYAVRQGGCVNACPYVAKELFWQIRY